MITYDEPSEHPYRVAVGRFKERWYQDTEIDAEWKGPAVTTVKKAAGGDWSFVALKRVGAALVENRHLLDEVDDDEVVGTLRNIDKRGLRAAADRGTAVHLLLERALADGGAVTVGPDIEAAEPYAQSVRDFIEHHSPRLVQAEFTVINRSLNGVGYGGTCDALIDIGGSLWLVDWKSRGEDSKHGAYHDEAAQLGAYSMAEYTIVDGERRPLPELAGGLVVSIRPDGYAVYPIDLTLAANHFTALHAWWVARRSERAAIGKMWPKVKTTPPPSDRRAALLARFALLNEVDQARFRTLGIPRDDLDAIEAALDEIDPFASTNTKPAVTARTERAPVVTLPTPVVEGGPVEEVAMDGLKTMYEALDAAARSWVGQIDIEARQADRSIRMNGDSGERTVRRFHLNRALIALAGNGFDDADAVRALCALTIGPELAYSMSLPLGALIGCHGLREATEFAEAAEKFIAGGFALSFRPEPTLTPSAA